MSKSKKKIPALVSPRHQLLALFIDRAFYLPVQSATIYVCGLSYSHVRINGQPASNQLLTTSAWTNNEKRNTYSALDVTHLLRKGSNAVGVVLGHGTSTTRLIPACNVTSRWNTNLPAKSTSNLE